MALKIHRTKVEGPSAEPISLAEVKVHLGFDADASRPEDDAITGMIKAARLHCEAYQNRKFITQTWDMYLDALPAAEEIELLYPPLQSVTHLKYKEVTAGTLTTWASSNYIVDIVSEPGRIVLKKDTDWPDVYDEAQAVQIRFVCGYGDAATDVPYLTRQAILRKIADLYEHRGDSASDAIVEEAINNLLFPEKVVSA